MVSIEREHNQNSDQRQDLPDDGCIGACCRIHDRSHRKTHNHRNLTSRKSQCCKHKVQNQCRDKSQHKFAHDIKGDIACVIGDMVERCYREKEDRQIKCECCLDRNRDGHMGKKREKSDHTADAGKEQKEDDGVVLRQQIGELQYAPL